MPGNVSRQYLKAMGIDCWVPRAENPVDDALVVESPGDNNSVANVHSQPGSRAPAVNRAATSGTEPSTNVSINSPADTSPAPVNPPSATTSLQPVAQWPLNSLQTMLAECRVVAAEQVATPADEDRPMLLVLERELTSPAEDLLAAMLKAIKVDRLAQFAATVSPSAAAEPLADVCGRLRPSLVLIMATLSDATALPVLEPHRSELHRVAWLDVPVAITLHPQVLLENPQGKRPAWEDLKRVKTFLDGR